MKAILDNHNQKRGGKLDWILPALEGLNLNDPASIGECETPATQNTVYDGDAAETRPGRIKLTTTVAAALRVSNGYAFNKKDGTKFAVYARGQYVYRYDNAGGEVQIGGPFTNNTEWDFTVFKDTLLGCNGYDGIWGWTGTGTMTLVTSFAAQYVRTHRNRIYAAARNVSEVRFTDAGSATSWPTNNVQEVNTDDGQIITGLEKMTNQLKIFKSGSIWTVKGEPLGAGTNTLLGNLTLEQDDSDVGCCAFRTIRKVTGGLLLFMAPGGLYALENGKSYLISKKVSPLFESGMNPNQLSQSWGIYSPIQKKYLLGYVASGLSAPEHVLMLDLADMAKPKYSIWTDFPGSCAFLMNFTQQEVVLVGHPSKGYIVEAFQGYCDISGDNGTATAAAPTTLTDSSKSWATNVHKDAYIYILEGKGRGQKRFITANTSTQLTIDTAWSTIPDATSVYTIGGYDAYRDTKPDDFRKPQMIKRYKFLNVFTDVEGTYDLRYGAVYDFGQLGYQQTMSLDGGALQWDISPVTWDTEGLYWDSKSKLYRRVDLPGIGRIVQVRVGNNRANQPWRVTSLSITHKEKKSRPD